MVGVCFVFYYVLLGLQKYYAGATMLRRFLRTRKYMERRI